MVCGISRKSQTHSGPGHPCGARSSPWGSATQRGGPQTSSYGPRLCKVAVVDRDAKTKSFLYARNLENAAELVRALV